jgi:hypothetical protein
MTLSRIIGLVGGRSHGTAKVRRQPSSEMGGRGSFAPYRCLHVRPEISYEPGRRLEAIQDRRRLAWAISSTPAGAGVRCISCGAKEILRTSHKAKSKNKRTRL